MSSHIDSTTRRARFAVAFAFATQGGVFITLTTHLPEIAKRWKLLIARLMCIFRGFGRRLKIIPSSRAGLLLYAGPVIFLRVAKMVRIIYEAQALRAG